VAFHLNDVEAMMLTTLFPKFHRRYLECPIADWLTGFADWLVAVGYAHEPAHDHVRRLKQILEARESVTSDAMFSAAELATMFTSARQQPLFRGTQHAFTRFLAARDRLVVEPDDSRFASILRAYQYHLVEARGLAASTISQHLTCAAVFLAQSVPADTSLRDLAPQAVERFHDFRHSFAVQALLRWYRQGADVQSNLPKLAMYMGHVSIISAAYYLKWMPDIAVVASDRFEASFGYLISGGDS
jgi:hypothetical protein